MLKSNTFILGILRKINSIYPTAPRSNIPGSAGCALAAILGPTLGLGVSGECVFYQLPRHPQGHPSGCLWEHDFSRLPRITPTAHLAQQPLTPPKQHAHIPKYLPLGPDPQGVNVHQEGLSRGGQTPTKCVLESNTFILDILQQITAFTSKPCSIIATTPFT